MQISSSDINRRQEVNRADTTNATNIETNEQIISDAEIGLTEPKSEQRQPVQPYYGELKNFTGRRTIYSSLKKNELTAKNILNILPAVLREHDKNAAEIDYLYRYYKGEQPILGKKKIVRPEINHIVLENRAYEFVEFKKTNSFGEPVQYIQKGEKSMETVNPEISLLNAYMESEDKSSLDKDLGEWRSICGTAYRWVDSDTTGEEDEAPFEMSVPDPRRTFVVYSSDIKGEQLFSGYFSYFSDTVQTEQNKMFTNKYRIITIYTEDKVIKVRDGMSGNYVPQDFSVVKFNTEIDGKNKSYEEYPLVIPGRRIIEYPLNQARIGDIELVMSILNAINQVKSNDLDGIDQFVQSLLVFINQEIEPTTFKQLIALGAVEVNSQDPAKPADVRLLESQLNHTDTKVVTDDLYEAALSILGIPRLNQKASGGDTAQARMLGEGWTMGYQRAKQDDLSFKKSERDFLKTVLRICKKDTRNNVKGKITTLRLSDIDIRIPRDKSDNLLVKAQSLLDLLQAGVHPEIAFSIVGLFGDPHDVYQKSVAFQGEDFWKKVQQEVNKMAEKEQNGKIGGNTDQNKTTSVGEGKNQPSENTVSGQE